MSTVLFAGEFHLVFDARPRRATRPRRDLHRKLRLANAPDYFLSEFAAELLHEFIEHIVRHIFCLLANAGLVLVRIYMLQSSLLNVAVCELAGSHVGIALRANLNNKLHKIINIFLVVHFIYSLSFFPDPRTSC